MKKWILQSFAIVALGMTGCMHDDVTPVRAPHTDEGLLLVNNYIFAGGLEYTTNWDTLKNTPYDWYLFGGIMFDRISFDVQDDSVFSSVLLSKQGMDYEVRNWDFEVSSTIGVSLYPSRTGYSYGRVVKTADGEKVFIRCWVERVFYLGGNESYLEYVNINGMDSTDIATLVHIYN